MAMVPTQPSRSTGKLKKQPKKEYKPTAKPTKTKSTSALSRKKRKVYTEEELGIPKLNMITPVGVQKPKGKKKGKIFVDDQESMMTILAMVNADKEGQIESKMMKARQMEAIREARQKEAEARQEQKRTKLEETKDMLRKRRKQRPNSEANEDQQDPQPEKHPKTTKKRVSFG